MDIREKLVELTKRAIIDWEHGDVSEWIADRLIANGVTVQEWISVNDRLPEEAVDIIVYTTKKRIAFGYLYDGHFRDEEHEIMASWNIGEVTHWMPLPEPPKEVE